MKVGDHEIRIMHMDIDTESGEKQTRQAADGEETNKAQRVKHGRIVRDGPFVKCRGPIENLDRRRYGNQKTEQRKEYAGMNRLSGNKHVMAPNQKADHRNGKASEGNNVVAEYPFAGKTRDQLAYNTHGRQNHNVYRGMGIKPEEMLKQHRISSQSRIEDAQAKNPLESYQDQGNGDDRRAENKDNAGRVKRPDEERQTKPGHPGRAHLVDRDNKVEPGENRREAGDKNPDNREHHMGVGINTAVRRIEGPSRVHSAGCCGHQSEDSPNDKNIPARQIETGKSQVPRADHHRD